MCFFRIACWVFVTDIAGESPGPPLPRKKRNTMSGNASDQSAHKFDSTVLIVDDELFVRELVGRWLQGDGYRCIQAENAGAAREHLESAEIDAITLDIDMPGETGIELLQGIVPKFPDVPVVMLTTVSDTETIVNCMTHGACGYLVKPVEKEDVLFQVSSALIRRQETVSRKRAEEELRRLNEHLEQRVAEKTRALDEANQELRREISEHRLADAALREREARMRAIFETAADGIMTFDKRGNIETYNAAAAEIFGRSEEGLGGSSVKELISPPQGRPESAHIMRYLGVETSSVRSRPFEVEAVRDDGSVFPGHLTLSEFDIEGRRLFTALVRDLTEQKRLQCELAQAHKLESVGQLAAGIAHEINTPIQYVGDNTRFLRDSFNDLGQVFDLLDQWLQKAKDGQVDQQLVEQVESAVEQADLGYLADEIPRAIDESLDGVGRVASIVRAMKEFSHPGTDEKTPTDLKEAIETTVTVARNEWKYVAEMVLEFDPDLPSVPCLPGELNQVLLNLIVNAAHAIKEALGPEATTKGTITVGTRHDGSWAEIFVRDTGCGIPASSQPRVFDPFYTTKEVGKGTGQGLAMARSVIVDRHQGTIDFETELGKGTEFRIRLPLYEETQNDEHAKHQEAHSLCR